LSTDKPAGRLWLETAAIFAVVLGFLFALAPSAPFTKELGVCESGAVRDVLAGNVVLPHFLPGPMVHVPPLYWWTAALCVRAFGWTELALRLPSMIAAAASCALMFAWLAGTISRRAGFWAAASLLLCHFFTDAARQPRMDSMLALFVTAAAICLERAVAVTGSPAMNAADPAATATDGAVHIPIETRRRRLFLGLAALSMGLGILAKGVLGILLPGIALGFFMLIRRRFRELFRPDLIASFIVALGIGIGWYVAAFQVGGDKFLQWQVEMNLWNRFIPTAAGGAGYCAHPFYYFVPQTLKGFIPWSLYLPAAAVWLWPRKGRYLPEPVVYAVCWFAAIFIFFSSSQGKCLVYILPAFPPLAALTGSAIDRAAEIMSERRPILPLFTAGSVVIALGALAMALAGLAVVFAGLPASMPFRLHPTDRDFLEIFAGLAARRAPTLLAWIGGFFFGALLSLFAARRLNAHIQAVGVIVIAIAGTLFWFGVMNPALARRETLREFARKVAHIVPTGAVVGHIGLGDCELNFYSPQPLPEVNRFRCSDDAHLPDYIVLRLTRFEKMNAEQRACLEPVTQSADVDGKGPRILVERINTSLSKPVALPRQ
jgi:hypothetical protein